MNKITCSLTVMLVLMTHILCAQISSASERNRFSSGNEEDLNLVGNPGALQPDSLQLVGMRYSRSFWLRELDKKSFLLSMPVQLKYRLSVAVSDRGFNLYREQDYTVGYSQKFGKQITAGLRWNMHHVKFGEDYGSLNHHRITAGMQARLTSRLTTAVMAVVPVSQTMYNPLSDYSRIIISAAADYRFSPQFVVEGEVMQCEGSKPEIRNGFKYSPLNAISFSAEVNWMTMQTAYGFSVYYKRMKLIMETSYHRQLGFSPVCSLLFLLPKK
ncbi:MAG TPA: hypothetical protein PLG57_00225 [Bacteroidia bacterium]|nr:hypothetical protein [Bacteroidia bacterium]